MKILQKYTISVIVVASFLALVNATSTFGHGSEIGLLSYMARSNDLLLKDPTRSLDCFNKYLPLINQIASNYETNFKVCLNESEAASAKADDATSEQRNNLGNAAEASCALLQQCQQDNSVEGIFQCYINGGSANIQTMYTINANASQELAALREQYYLIRNDEYRCTNETKRIYERESAEAYAGLNNCILGNNEEPPTTAATTTDATTKATEATTSVEPETTTIAPETTETAPVETTSGNSEATTNEQSEATEGSTSLSP